MPTMQDVAKKAGVTLSTVSHTLSGKRPVAEETRQRVLQAMKDLDYHPNELARRLAHGKSKIIGLLFPKLSKDLSNMQLEFVYGALEAAEKYNYALQFWTSPVDDNEILKFAHESLVEGLILMEITLKDVRCEKLQEIGFPFCMIGHMADSGNIGYVDLDIEYVACSAVEYLVQLGHRYIAYLGYPDDLLKKGYGPAVHALEGYRAAIRKAGLSEFYFPVGASSHQGYKTVQGLLANHPEVTSIVTLNEVAIPGMYQAIAEAGLKIPDDFSVVASASARRAESLIPKLTTIDFPAYEEGQLAVETLIKTLTHPEKPPSQKLLRTKLIIRESSGPCPKRE
jgi:DNA-binding LacI/PurR family transcriptional regulator